MAQRPCIKCFEQIEQPRVPSTKEPIYDLDRAPIQDVCHCGYCPWCAADKILFPQYKEPSDEECGDKSKSDSDQKPSDGSDGSSGNSSRQDAKQNLDQGSTQGTTQEAGHKWMTGLYENWVTVNGMNLLKAVLQITLVLFLYIFVASLLIGQPWLVVNMYANLGALAESFGAVEVIELLGLLVAILRLARLRPAKDERPDHPPGHPCFKSSLLTNSPKSHWITYRALPPEPPEKYPYTYWNAEIESDEGETVEDDDTILSDSAAVAEKKAKRHAFRKLPFPELISNQLSFEDWLEPAEEKVQRQCVLSKRIDFDSEKSRRNLDEHGKLFKGVLRRRGFLRKCRIAKARYQVRLERQSPRPLTQTWEEVTTPAGVRSAVTHLANLPVDAMIGFDMEATNWSHLSFPSLLQVQEYTFGRVYLIDLLVLSREEAWTTTGDDGSTTLKHIFEKPKRKKLIWVSVLSHTLPIVWSDQTLRHNKLMAHRMFEAIWLVYLPKLRLRWLGSLTYRSLIC